jgi:hypothetical protein
MMQKAKTKRKSKKNNIKMPSKQEWLKKFFGKIKGFGDGVEYQRKMRDE